MSASRPGSSPSSKGTRLADRYTVDDPLGRGRYTVYRGEDSRLKRRVAIKEVPLAEGQEDAERVRLRAMREAHAAARLNNPNVVTVYDVIEEGGSIWLVMELVDALSLTDLVANEGPLTHGRTARIGLAVMKALQAAHAVGVVHRDVKPPNVLVGGDDHAKLADFGVATIRDESRVTAAGSIIGSPSYMAPEQAMAAEVGPPADLWALGATLYFAVEGKAPFTRDSPIATAAAVVNNDPDPQENRGPLSSLIERLLQKDPKRRPGAEEVRTMLTAAASLTSETSEGPTLVAAPSPAATTRTAASDPATDGSADDRGASDGDEAGPVAAQDDSEPARAVVESLLAAHPDRKQSQRVPVVLVAVLAVLILAGIGLLAVIADDRGGAQEDVASTPDGDGDPAGDTEAEETAAGEETDGEDSEDESGVSSNTTETPTTTSTETDDEPSPAVPDGWTLYENPDAGYVIARPEGWRVDPAGGSIVDFRDPDTGSYLRVDWTDRPGDDPVADWQSQAQGFASRYASYQEIRIEAYDYRDYNAAMWEFLHSAGGTQVHTGNLGFVTGGRGYALLFRTPAGRWDESQDIYATFRETFRPA